jgi:hypothetical protein
VSTVITWYFPPIAKPTLPAAQPGAGRPANAVAAVLSSRHCLQL